jgi:hypothetical protein
MNTKEMKETDGGVFWPIVRGILMVAGAIREIEAGCEWYEENSRRY